MPLNSILLLECFGLAVAVLWMFGLAFILMGTRRARRAFRGKGYLRPPTGKAWLRFIYYKHYDSFEDPAIRFYYRSARICLFLCILLVATFTIFMGSVVVLTHLSAAVPPSD